MAKILVKDWWNTTADDIRSCGSSEIVLFIEGEGLLYYLPAFLTNILKQRDFGWFEELLLPAHSTYKEVVDYFSGGTLQEPVNEEWWSFFWTRSMYTKMRLSTAQAEVVAKYIEIAESYRVDDPSAEFLLLLKKYTDFWRMPLADTFTA